MIWIFCNCPYPLLLTVAAACAD